jgi:hypothetical protein
VELTIIRTKAATKAGDISSEDEGSNDLHDRATASRKPTAVMTWNPVNKATVTIWNPVNKATVRRKPAVTTWNSKNRATASRKPTDEGTSSSGMFP